MKNEKNQNVLDELQEAMDSIEQQVRKLPELYMDVLTLGMGLDDYDPINSCEIADMLRGEYIDLTPELVEEAQADAVEMTKLLPQLEKTLPADLMVDPEFSAIGKGCTWRFLDSLRISDNVGDEKKLEAALNSEYGDAEFVKMPMLRDLYEYRGDADIFCDETLRPDADDIRKIKEFAKKVACMLRKMGKPLVPDVKWSYPALDVLLEYVYLDANPAKLLTIHR